ncbi:PH domain-containing protein [Mycoplasmatota bacterium WC44]
MYFVSKRDLWLGILIFGFIGGITLFMIIDIGLTMISVLFLIVFGFCCWLWFRTGYRIVDGEIIIYSGPFKSRVNINEITTIRKTSSIISSPALSLDRIELMNNKKTLIIISPKDKDAFFTSLLFLNSNIKIKA